MHEAMQPVPDSGWVLTHEGYNTTRPRPIKKSDSSAGTTSMAETRSIGRTDEISGRRPLLVIGWGLLPLQGFLYAALPGPYALVLCNLLNAVSGAIFGVTMTVVAADLTRRTRWLQSRAGCTWRGGFRWHVVEHLLHGVSAAAFGAPAAALSLAMVGLCGLLVLWVGMPETRPSVALIPTGVTVPR
jgi:hypothetical protein